jgi:hypothetical protein
MFPCYSEGVNLAVGSLNSIFNISHLNIQAANLRKLTTIKNSLMKNASNIFFLTIQQTIQKNIA